MKISQPGKSLVLYADDDVDDLQLVTEAFRQFSQNVEVITCSDGIDALAWLDAHRDDDIQPCLIILDINMPRLDGKQTLRRLRDFPEHQETPVIVFTTSSLSLDKTFAAQYKAGFITKPLDVKQMDRVTAEFISRCSENVQEKIALRA